MLRFYILIALFKAVVECRLQAGLVATCREVYARLQVWISRRSVFHAANIWRPVSRFSVAANIQLGSLLRYVDELVRLKPQLFGFGEQFGLY